MAPILALLETSDLPGLNACLNATAAVLLVAGFACVKARALTAHKACMLLATLTSAAFLTSYLVYHARVGSVAYQGQGPIRTIYFGVLLSHTILAVVNVPLVILTLTRALRGRLDAHRRIARITLPVWLYVSVTGVVVYWMLYRA